MHKEWGGGTTDIESLSHETKRKYWISEYALNRIKKNQNYMLLITGGTGSGKSYSAIEIALDMDKTFNIDRVVFTAIEFMNLLITSKNFKWNRPDIIR